MTVLKHSRMKERSFTRFLTFQFPRISFIKAKVPIHNEEVLFDDAFRPNGSTIGGLGSIYWRMNKINYYNQDETNPCFFVMYAFIMQHEP